MLDLAEEPSRRPQEGRDVAVATVGGSTRALLTPPSTAGRARSSR
ncbi:hypothetical protein [Streptomyces sp. AC555_RSS877]|nr:hypothetical protein [Streptomyces sp. AC555_RSS877]